MELVDKQLPHTQKSATDTVTLAAGEKLRIQKWTVADGIVDILAEETVPAGKQWSASIVLDIQETDA
jgi:hypothetical protein